VADPYGDRISKEALMSMDGAILPVTIEVDGEKQIVGVAALSYVDGSVHVEAEITDPRIGEIMMSNEAAYFSAPKINPIELPTKPTSVTAKWKEGLTDGGQ